MFFLDEDKVVFCRVSKNQAKDPWERKAGVKPSRERNGGGGRQVYGSSLCRAEVFPTRLHLDPPLTLLCLCTAPTVPCVLASIYLQLCAIHPHYHRNVCSRNTSTNTAFYIKHTRTHTTKCHHKALDCHAFRSRHLFHYPPPPIPPHQPTPHGCKL